MGKNSRIVKNSDESENELFIFNNVSFEGNEFTHDITIKRLVG